MNQTHRGQALSFFLFRSFEHSGLEPASIRTSWTMKIFVIDDLEAIDARVSSASIATLDVFRGAAAL